MIVSMRIEIGALPAHTCDEPFVLGTAMLALLKAVLVIFALRGMVVCRSAVLSSGALLSITE